MSEEVDYDGFLAKRIGNTQTKKKTFKYYYFNLIGGSLHYYKDIDDAEPKGTIELKDLKLNKEERVDDRLAFSLSNDKNSFLFVVDEEADWKEWTNHIESNLGKDSKPPLKKEKKKRRMQNALQKAKKNFGNKLANTSIGKGILKNSIPDEVSALISSLKRIVEKEIDAKKASEVEKNLIKIGVNIYFLLEGGQLSFDDMLNADKPLRVALETLSKCHDHARYSRKVNEALLKEKLEQVQAKLNESATVLTTLLSPHVKAKNVQLVKSTADSIGTAAFLFKILMDESLVDEVQDLITAGEHYTQFHFYTEK